MSTPRCEGERPKRWTHAKGPHECDWCHEEFWGYEGYQAWDWWVCRPCWGELHE